MTVPEGDEDFMGSYAVHLQTMSFTPQCVSKKKMNRKVDIAISSARGGSHSRNKPTTYPRCRDLENRLPMLTAHTHNHGIVCPTTHLAPCHTTDQIRCFSNAPRSPLLKQSRGSRFRRRATAAELNAPYGSSAALARQSDVGPDVVCRLTRACRSCDLSC